MASIRLSKNDKFMTDVHSRAVRSYNMSKIRSKNTKPEIVVRGFLFRNGFRYRLHVSYLPGKPDIVLKKYMTVVFVHGCFWHGHRGCPFFKLPQTRQKWWSEKISKNQYHDKINKKKLRLLGWNVVELWECQIKKNKHKHKLKKLIQRISND